jgi:hypothetical protein
MLMLVFNNYHIFCFLVDFLKLQWKYLKDNLKRCLDRRNREMRSGAAACKTSTCKYFENLAFLQDKIANRDTVSNVKLGLGSTADSSLLPEQPVVTIKDEETPSVKKRKTLYGVICSHEKRPVSRARKASDQVDTMLLKALKDLDKPTTQEMPEAKSAESDSDTLFCQSLIPTLKSLGTKENMKAKVQIQQLLFTLKFPDSEE